MMLRVAALICLLAAGPALAQTPQSLLQRGELRAAVVVDSAAPHYQRAPVVIAVEVATPRWFSRGTRVLDFRVPGAVVRPVSNFADNQTRSIDGASWSVQRWRFRLYAQEPGRLTLPALPVFVSVNTEDAGTVEGELRLDAPGVEISAPAGTDGLVDWVATPSLTVRERWEGLRDEYRVGDAVTRLREFVVADTPAMMLQASRTLELDGLSIYPAPASVNDRSDRGRLIGTRTEELIITLERAGHYEIPGEDFYWFNLSNRRVEQVTLPPYSFDVLAGQVNEETPKVATAFPMREITWVLTSVLLLITIWLIFRRSTRLASLRRFLEQHLEKHRLQRRYRSALRRGDSRAAVELLRLRAVARREPPRLHASLRGNEAARVTLRQLLAHGYGSARELPPEAETDHLWRAIGAARRATADSGLPLNPGASVPEG